MSKRVTVSECQIDLNQMTFPFSVKNMETSTGRVYRHYSEMEEFSAGMWSGVSTSQRIVLVEKASRLMASSSTFKEAMLKAIKSWPVSTEVNLSDIGQNRIAWMGHAGCCIGVNSPEDVTREAWWTLTGTQQDDANRVAAEVIKEWELARYAEAIPRN